MPTPIETTYNKELKIEKRENYSWLHAGPFSDLGAFEFKHPLLRKKRGGKLFLKEPLGLTAMQISLNKLPAGAAVPFFHKHKLNEEVYIFVKGKGQMQIDDEIFDIEEGSAVKVDPSAARTWRNNGSEDLYYIVIQAKANSLEQDTFDDGEPCPERQVQW